ncbi:peptidase [Mesorhizobium marinum]|uniref:peptidase n=1 Tax=Mesorhizobium marinum TaxID=3228790 RepID=UPI0034667A77
MDSVIFLRGVAAALGALVLLSACTVVVEEPGPGPGPGYCTRDYRPVCALAAGERRTFANACLADRAGYRVVHRGECRRGNNEGEQRFCTREYRPVCAQRRGQLRTFGNACEADAAGWRVVGRGEC